MCTGRYTPGTFTSLSCRLVDSYLCKSQITLCDMGGGGTISRGVGSDYHLKYGFQQYFTLYGLVVLRIDSSTV